MTRDSIYNHLYILRETRYYICLPGRTQGDTWTDSGVPGGTQGGTWTDSGGTWRDQRGDLDSLRGYLEGPRGYLDRLRGYLEGPTGVPGQIQGVPGGTRSTWREQIFFKIDSNSLDDRFSGNNWPKFLTILFK